MTSAEPAPVSFLQLWDAQKAARGAVAQPASAAGTVGRSGGASAYGAATLDALAGEVAAAPAGARNDTLNRAALRAYRLAEAGALDHDDVTRALGAADGGLDHAATARTLQSAREAAARLGPADLPESTTTTTADPFGAGRYVGAAMTCTTDPVSATPADVPSTGKRMVLTSAADIKPRRVRWLWDGRLAVGTLGLLAGREGLGKSTIGYWLAARVTRGELPGEYAGTARGVLVCATEDSWAHTIVPRLMAAGADLARVHRVEMMSADDIHLGLSLPRDLDELGDAAETTDAAMLLLDPLMSRLGDNLDTHKDGDVRRALEPLVSVADRTGMAVLGLIHHNKSGSNDPLNLVMASKAFTAVARSVSSVIPDPDDDTETRRLFGTPKNNLGRTDLPTLSFTVVGHPIETDDGTAWTGRIEWGDDSTETIGEAMRRGNEAGDDRSATSEATDWLADWLRTQGGEASGADAKAAGRKAGHSPDALKRATRKPGFTTRAFGFPRQTCWAVTPNETAVGAQSEQARRGDTPTALTAPTGEGEPQSVQSVQLVQSAQAPEQPRPLAGEVPPWDRLGVNKAA